MSAVDGVVAGIIAGAFMAAVSEVGYRLRCLRSNLILTDGDFATKLVSPGTSKGITYTLGVVVHLITSAVFGLVYAGVVHVLDTNAESAAVIAPYVFLLWLAMLLVALPVAGQGLLGWRAGKYAWVEQLLFHAVFGAAFWWALRAL
jgi:hypothetical protein